MTRLLLPLPKRVWSPSLSLPRDQFGSDAERTRFRVRAKANDGAVIWTGWFEDRDDFDAFLWAIASGTLKQERALWDLPTPNWQPWMGEVLSYDFASTVYITGPVGSPQNYQLPGDWNPNDNTIECVGAGAEGGAYIVGSNRSFATGGGGGGYSKVQNAAVAGSVPYFVGGSTQTEMGQNYGIKIGVDGGDTYFGNLVCLAKGGTGGHAGAVGDSGDYRSGYAGTAGGLAASGVGSVKFSGGYSGTTFYGVRTIATGGGGAAGMFGDGGSAAYGADNGGWSGGNADAGKGGAGGGAYVAGGNGSEWAPGVGSGGGGGGIAAAPAGDATAPSGGGYGGGGGGLAVSGYSGTVWRTGIGGQGIIVLTYTPKPMSFFNMPMVGM